MTIKWNLLLAFLLFVLIAPLTQAAPYKVDGSSPEAFKSSINYISKDLSDEQKLQLALALLKLKLAGVNSASQLAERPELMGNEPTQELLDTVNGLTYREIITLAEQTSTIEISLGNKNNDRPSAIPEPPITPKFREFVKDPEPLIVRPEPKEEGYDLTAIHVDMPNWPPQALANGQEGWVLLEFKLDKKGSPVNLNILDSSPETLFVESALDTMPKWLFEIPPGHAADTVYQYLLKYELDDDPYDFGYETDVSELPLSTISVTALKVISIDQESLTMSMDYEIKPFHQGDRIYNAMVLFKQSDGYFDPVPFSPDEMIYLTEASGTRVFSTPVPDPYELELLKGELQFMLMLMQRSDNKGTTTSIGSSRIFRKQLDGFE